MTLKGHPQPVDRSPEERFWSHVNKVTPTGCWQWTAGLDRGYGFLWVEGRSQRAHRLVYRFLFGMIVPEDLEIDHMCRNRACCNPDHLRIVTPRVNSIENNMSPFAINRAKTHCKRGHLFDEANTGREYRDGKAFRQCRACLKLRPSYLKKLKPRDVLSHCTQPRKP